MIDSPRWAAVVTLFLVSFLGPMSVSAQDGERLNRSVELLANGQAAFGTISGDLSLADARAVARSGTDFIIIDMEHTPWDAETLRVFLLGMIDRQSTATSGSLQMPVTPIVRIPSNGREMGQFLAKQALDVGVFGVMFPFVETREETLNAVAAMRYPRPEDAARQAPRGIRGRSPGNASWYWGVSGGQYYQRAEVWPLDPRGELLAVIQIETPDGVANIEEIITVPGVGVIFVGPSDLATQMGHGAQPNHPDVEAAIQAVLQACLRHDVPCAITTGAGDVAERIGQGFRFVTVGVVAGMPAATVEGLRVGREAAGRR